MTPDQTYTFEAGIWLYPTSKAPWFFITVPKDMSDEIRFFAGRTNGFGSVRIRAQIGATRWQTSLFPDKASGCYFLPVKADVRAKEGIAVGDNLSVRLDPV